MSRIIIGRFGGGRFGDMNLHPKSGQLLVASGRSTQTLEPRKAPPVRVRGGALVAQDPKTRRAA